MKYLPLLICIALLVSCQNSKEELKDWDEIVLELEVAPNNQNEITIDSSEFTPVTILESF